MSTPQWRDDPRQATPVADPPTEQLPPPEPDQAWRGTWPPPPAPPYGDPPGPPGEHPRGRGRTKLVAGAVVLALASGLTGAVATELVSGDDQLAAPTVVAGDTSKAAGGAGLAEVAAAVQPKVVSLTVQGIGGSSGGSGVIMRSDGMILTNNHVVAGSGGGRIQVAFSDGTTAAATVVGTDPATDLAVVKAEGAADRSPATLGDSDRLRVGDPVLALGSPLGLQGSVSAGIVSALHRTITVGGESGQPGAIGDAIQTDAAINPGNSGGALVNAFGQVIGINTAIATTGGNSGNIGVGFAIPINQAKQIAEQLIDKGKATHAFLGVNLTDPTGGQKGVLVVGVQEGSPAAEAGLRPGDRITKIDDRVLVNATSLIAAIRTHQPGDQVVLTYERDGRTGTASVTLADSLG